MPVGSASTLSQVPRVIRTQCLIGQALQKNVKEQYDNQRFMIIGVTFLGCVPDICGGCGQIISNRPKVQTKPDNFLGGGVSELWSPLSSYSPGVSHTQKKTLM